MKRRICVFFILVSLLLSSVGCSQNTSDSTPEQQETVPAASSADSSVHAADLLTKSVPEIIEMMGGEFNYRQDAESFYDKVFDEDESNHGFYIYNFNVFPGMLFYLGNNAESQFGFLKDEMDEAEALDKMGEDIRAGKYIELAEIYLFGSAKVDDRICADMDYNELTKAWGYLETLKYYGDFLRQYISEYNPDIYLLEVYYQTSNHADKEFNDFITKEEMISENPEISYISIAPTPAGGWQKAYYRYINNNMDTSSDWSGYLFKMNNDSFPEMLIDYYDGGKTPLKLLRIDASCSVKVEDIEIDTDDYFFIAGDKHLLIGTRKDEKTEIDAYYLDDMGVMTEGFKKLYSIGYTGDTDFKSLIDTYRDDKEPDVKTYYDKDGKETDKKEFIKAITELVDFEYGCVYSDSLSPFKYFNAKSFIMSYQDYR